MSLYLINNDEEIQRYLSVEIPFSNIEPFVRKAERDKIVSIIGNEEYLNLKSIDHLHENEQNPRNQVRKLFEEASANLALYYGYTFNKIKVSSAGGYRMEMEKASSTAWHEDRDLLRNCLKIGYEAIDSALVIMEENSDMFSSWKETKGFTIFNELIVKTVDDFQRFFSINNSRQTFLQLRPFLLDVQEMYIKNALGNCYASIEGNNALKNYIQGAIVHKTIAEVLEMHGMFSIQNNALMAVWEQLPWEKSKGYDHKAIHEMVDARNEKANQYLNKALEVSATLECSKSTEPNFPSDRIIKKKSFLGL